MTPKQVQELRNFLDSKEFYNTAQQYRHAPVWEQDEVVNAYEDLKKHIIEQVQRILNNP